MFLTIAHSIKQKRDLGVLIFTISLLVFAIGFILLTIVIFKFNKTVYQIAKYTLLASGILLMISCTLCSENS